MTMIDGGVRSGSQLDRAWHEVEPDFWVASADGAFLGTVERHPGDRFFARGGNREYVGEYATLAKAQAAVIRSA